jgi:hypothetical protein
MGLTPDTMYSSVRVVGDVEVVDADGKISGEERGAIGTGFCVRIASETLPKRRYGYLLTADHVLEGQDDVAVQFADPFSEGAVSDAVPVTDWRRPLDDLDLAVTPMSSIPSIPGLRPSVLDWELHAVQESHLGIGAIVYYVGLLAPLDRPMARSGTVGALHQENIDHDGGYAYPAHLVDCRSYDGFSGSPCYLELPYVSLTPGKLPYTMVPPTPGPLGGVGYLALLCGMFTEHLHDNNVDGTVSRYGVGIMLRLKEIEEALMTDDMRAERREWDGQTPSAEPRLKHAKRARTPRAKSDEFGRFEDLTRKLVQTPKPEKSDEES